MSECLAECGSLTAKERDYLKRLRRRADWLRDRIRSRVIKPGDWDVAELHALEFVIEYVETSTSLTYIAKKMVDG